MNSGESSSLCLPAALGIVALAALLRFWNLRYFPGWYVDEGDFIIMASNFLHGNLQHLGNDGNPLGIGRPYLFIEIQAALFAVFGVEIIVLRIFAVICACSAIFFTYLVAHKALGKTAGIAAGIFLACEADTILLHRIGSTYQLTTMLSMAALYYFMCWQATKQSKCFMLALGLAAVSLSSDFIGVFPVLVILLLGKYPTKRRFLLCAGYAFLPLFVTTLIPNMLSFGKVGHTGFFDTNFNGSMFDIAELNLARMMLRLQFFILGLVGFILASRSSEMRTVRMFFLPLLIFTLLFRVNMEHRLIPLLPYIAIGLVALAKDICSRAAASLPLTSLADPVVGLSDRRSAVIAMLNLAGFLVVLMLPSFGGISETVYSAIAARDRTIERLEKDVYISPEAYFSGAEVDAMVARISPEIASTDSVYGLAITLWGLPGKHLPIDRLSVEADEQRRDANFRTADFVLIDQYTRILEMLGSSNPEREPPLDTWPVVFASAHLAALENPKRHAQSPRP